MWDRKIRKENWGNEYGFIFFSIIFFSSVYSRICVPTTFFCPKFFCQQIALVGRRPLRGLVPPYDSFSAVGLRNAIQNRAGVIRQPAQVHGSRHIDHQTGESARPLQKPRHT